MAQNQRDLQGEESGEVADFFQRELARIRGSSNALESLGAESEETLREAFLRVTKRFHPSRFARRSEEVRKLASDHYLALKEAYELGKRQEREAALRAAREAKTAPVTTSKVSTKAKEPSSAAREELQKRRRAKVAERLDGTNPRLERSAQIRAATHRAESESGKLNEGKAFEEAKKLSAGGQYEEAAAAFKSLAVENPVETKFRLYMHFCQGKQMQEDGRLDDARAEYKRCLGLDASFEEAHQALASVSSGEPRKKGLWSKLFGKGSS